VCLKNGVKETYWGDYAELRTVIDNIQGDFKASGEVKDRITEKKLCRADCIVHHEGD